MSEALGDLSTIHYGKSPNEVTLEMCNGLEVPFPQSPDEVALITGKLERQAESERRHSEQLRKLKGIKQGLMHDLLTGKVPVNPDPPEPANA